jgi:mannitol/fructose-specific phosphotransferase system IIA component (Ntr-type)
MRSILNALQEGRLFELPETGKARALEFLARILDANPDIEVGSDTIEEIQKREQECNTGIGLGVGVPHVRAKREEGELFCAIGWSSQGIDYGAADGKPVHLVVMYHIPGAQKNVYLKEISGLVKAIRKSGGMDPIAHAPDLNAVRNLLLDWVSAVLGDTGPEAVARMIKLEVKQAQAGAALAAPLTAEAAAAGGRRISRVMGFSVLVAPPNGVLVLAPNADWVAALEKETGLAQNLAGNTELAAAGHQLFVIGSTPYAGGRVLYQCVAVMNGSPAPAK